MHFVNTLERGKSKTSHVPVIVVGPQGVGKTSLIYKLIDQSVREEKQAKRIAVRNYWSKLYMDKDEKFVSRDTKISYEEDLNHYTMANAMKSAEGYAECNESDEDINFEEKHCNVNETKSLQYPVYQTHSSIYLEDDEFASDEFRDNDAVLNSSNASSQKLNVGKANLDYRDKRLEDLDMLYIKNVLCKKKHSSCDYLYVSYLDFAGDYYNLHQPYMRPNTVYLVVLDPSEPLDALMKESESYKGDNGILRHTVTAQYNL
ncbi:hypothetical protein CHS0354_043123 [Potamilus streckersoni]|uniref:Uncharacterized protein n=1 Tax=Potamilus streckersoni TaxID=2493646 RepID=A0AAE0SBQ0_9BIVA|nr:hypothetical protein CHS0354_043123 [Potamilus streckersoni]